MFAGDEKGVSLVDLTENVPGTTIAIFDPHITDLHRFEPLTEQRAFLRIALFTRKDIGDEALGCLVDHLRFAGPGTPLGLAHSLMRCSLNACSYNCGSK